MKSSRILLDLLPHPFALAPSGENTRADRLDETGKKKEKETKKEEKRKVMKGRNVIEKDKGKKRSGQNPFAMY